MRLWQGIATWEGRRTMTRRAWMAVAVQLASVSTGLLLFALGSVAHASGPRAALNAMEASMLVTGTIDVDRDGRVERFAIDQRDKLPVPVDRLLADTLPTWRFEPTLVAGEPAAVSTSMRVRVAANRVPDQPDSYVVRITGASFGGSGNDGLEAGKGNQPPTYPSNAARHRVQGTVYLLVRVGRTGNVEDVFAEQVNLQLIAADRVMRGMRAAFERAAIHAAREWTFVTPSEGVAAEEPYWVARVPVAFVFPSLPQPGYGEWATYVPGPRQSPAWGGHDAAVGPDSFAANQVYLVGSGPKLLTPLGG